jgi:hypothetical protein
MRWSMPRKGALAASLCQFCCDGHELQSRLTVGGDGKLVSRGLVEEGALVEELVASLVVVGEGNLDLAILDLGQGDREGRVPLLKVDGSGADGSHEGGKSGGGDLHDFDLWWLG